MDPNHHSPPKRSHTQNLRTVKAGVSALVWELRFFDVTTIGQPDDPKVRALADRINAALADIFGRDSQEYGECSVRSFHSAPPAPDSENTLSELRQSYQRGINRAIQNLGLLLDNIDRKLGTAEGATRLGRRAGAEAGGPEGGKVSLVTMRAKSKARPAPSAAVSGVSPGDDEKHVKRKPGFRVVNDKVVDLHIVLPEPEGGPAGSGEQDSARVCGKSSKKKGQPKAGKACRTGKKQKQESPSSGEPQSIILKFIEEALKSRQTGGPDQEKSAQPEPEVAASLPQFEPPKDAPTIDALLPVAEATLAGADEAPAWEVASVPTEESLPFPAFQESQDAPAHEEPSAFQPHTQGAQDRIPWSPGEEPAPEASAEHVVELSAAPSSPDSVEPVEVAMTAFEDGGIHDTSLSAHPEEEEMGEMEAGLFEPAGQPLLDLCPPEPLQEEPSLPGNGPSSDGATERADEPQWRDEFLSVEDWTSKLRRHDAGTEPDAMRGELAAALPEQAKEPASPGPLDLGDIEDLADRFAEGMAGLSGPKKAETSEERLSSDTVFAPAELDRPSEETSPAPAESTVQPHPEPVAKPPEVEQNPFAIKDFEKKELRPKITGAAELRTQISSIMERIDDLKDFDVTGVTERFDLKARKLRDAVNNTIADVFGRNTRAYWHHSLPSFDAIPVVLGSPKPSPVEVRDFYQHGIDKAVKKLNAIVESLKERLEQWESRDSSRSASPGPKTET